MEKHAEDARRKAMVIDIDMLVPKDHLLRKIEKVMDYDWLYDFGFVLSVVCFVFGKAIDGTPDVKLGGTEINVFPL